MSVQTQAATAEEIVARVERLPVSWWHVKTRIIIGVATFFDAFDALAIASVLPAIVPMWKLTPPQIGFLISAGFLGQLLGALFFGWIAEKYGRMTGMIWSIATFAVMSFVCALAWNYESLLVFRLIQGFGLGGEVPIAAVYISELARSNVRGRFVMLYELIFPVGIVAASLLGLWVVPMLGWQYMFLVGGIPAVLVLFLRRVLPEIAAMAGECRPAARSRSCDRADRTRNREGHRAAAAGGSTGRQGRGKACVTLRPFRAALFAQNACRLADLVHRLSGELRPLDLDADGLPHRVQAAARCCSSLRLDNDCIRSHQRGNRRPHHRPGWTQTSVRDLLRRCGGRADSSVADFKSIARAGTDFRYDLILFRQCDKPRCLFVHAGALSNARARSRGRGGDGLAAACIDDRPDHCRVHDCQRAEFRFSGVRCRDAGDRYRHSFVRSRNQEARPGGDFALTRRGAVKALNLDLPATRRTACRRHRGISAD